MARVSYVFGSWQPADHDEVLGPGESHEWEAWGFGYGDAISVTAHSTAGEAARYLGVENVRVLGMAGNRRVLFTVRNVGHESVPAYGVGASWISRE